MTPERWQQINNVFQSAIDLPSAEWSAFLNEACAGDPELRKEVESLLSAHKESTERVMGPVSEAAEELLSTNASVSMAGRRIGAYQIVSEIGRGGMGVVYLASRADNQYRKQVAIKLVKKGMDTDAILQRFRNERQILAGLDHPNIVKLLDGGITEDGLPYFVMDYLPDLPITTYCDTHRLSVNDRLKLFLTVCSAVHYAHQNLVVHRDLKPSNILVTPEGIPKVLDFGIAKLLNPDLSARTLSIGDGPGTEGQSGIRLLTPHYASPEQVLGDHITTTTDVYSLGVLLYELLTGRRPHRITKYTPREIERAICEEEPEKPSAVLGRVEDVPEADAPGTVPTTSKAISEARGMPLERLRRRLAGDLDNIVLMAMRKEPQRRYSSVGQFADDIRRHLEGLPVIARSDTVGYRLGKFLVRHKGSVTAAALVVLMLVAGIIATSWQARKASLERARAERRFNDVRALAHSLIFELHGSIEKLAGSTVAQQLLVKRALEYLDRLVQEARGDASLQLELAAAYARLGTIQWNLNYANLGDLTGALQSQRKALSIRTAVVEGTPNDQLARRDLALSYRLVGDLLAATGDLGGALEHYRKPIKILEELTAGRPQETALRRELAISYERMGDRLGNPSYVNLDKRLAALESYRKMRAIFEALVAEDPANTQNRHSLAISYHKFARLLAVEGNLKGALDLYRKELAIFQENAASSPSNVWFRRDVAVGFGDVGDTLSTLGDYDGALKNYHACLKIRQELIAADPANAGARRDMAFIQDVIAATLAAKGYYTEALDYYDKALAGFEALYEADKSNQAIRMRLARTLNRVAGLYAKRRQTIQARRYGIRSLAIHKAHADHPKASPRDLNEYAHALLTCEPVELRDLQAARIYAQRAAEQTKEKDPIILDTLALSFYLAGDSVHAAEKEERALTLLPTSSPRRREMEAQLAKFKEAARLAHTENSNRDKK